jgi:hypothetical protein
MIRRKPKSTPVNKVGERKSEAGFVEQLTRPMCCGTCKRKTMIYLSGNYWCTKLQFVIFQKYIGSYCAHWK